jgi:hypothetical protein
MAEIKSTLEMVLERAAQMAAEAENGSEQESTEHQGMRLAAAYLNGEQSDLMEILKKQPPEIQLPVRGGMARTLLRNIVLPRDGTISASSLLSLKALQDISGSSADILTLCSEIKQILEQYTDHRGQVQQQFDDSMLAQLKMNLQQQGLAVDDEMALNPAMHPKYQEEWNRVSSDLNAQYGEALDQRKDQIGQRLGAR